jgi:hypothetical protein
MKKSLSRNLYLIALVASIVGIVLFASSGVSVSTTTTGLGGTTGAVTGGNTAFIAGSIVLFIVGGILGLVSWIGALIKTAQLGRWGWFVGILLFSTIGMLIYVFGGPTTAKTATA